MKKQEAIIRIAKKLLRRIMHLWKEKEDYIFTVSYFLMLFKYNIFLVKIFEKNFTKK
jgi:hypothetical protein